MSEKSETAQDKLQQVMEKFNAIIPHMTESDQKACLAFGEGLIFAADKQKGA